MRPHSLIYATLLPQALASVVERDACSSGYTLCSPAGATSLNTPQIGSPEFLSLFVDIVSSSLPSSGNKRAAAANVNAVSLCCNALLSCMLMSHLAIPFCYDRFTTNYLLPDSSAGTVVGGTYTNSGGDVVNLLSGQFKLTNGTTGNIYSANPNAKPNTATLSMPSQFTGSGIGGPIPTSNLGFLVTLTYTTTIPGTTRLPVTLPASTIPGHMTTQATLVPSTITTMLSNIQIVTIITVTSYTTFTVGPIVVPATTIPGTTIPPRVTVITTTQAMASMPSTSSSGNTTASASASALTTFKSEVEGRRNVGFGSICLSFAMALGAWIV
jgi:hypothetical protein